MSPYVRKTAAHAIPKLYRYAALDNSFLIGLQYNLGYRAGCGHCVVFLGKTLELSQCLSQDCK